MRAKRSLAFYDKFAQAKGGRCRSTDYIGANGIYKWECAEGHHWMAPAGRIQQGSWCPKCSSTSNDLNHLHKLAADHQGKCLSPQYINARTKYEWECSKGHRWTARPGQWCRICVGHNRRRNITDVRNLALKLGGQFLSTEYKGNKFKHEWVCFKGHKWSTRFNDIDQGHWCPKCAGEQSQSELAIYKIVCAAYPDAVSRVKGLLPSKGLELDIYVPSLQKAIEFDGDYWHSLLEAQERDKRKDQQCLQVGISLLRVKECDYISDIASIHNRILEFLASPNL